MKNASAIKKTTMPTRQVATPTNAAENAMLETMSDARYLRQSSGLINDALQKGFDVLQLSDGDIVMTGVKTVVYQYTWDEKKGELVRTKATSTKYAPTPHHPRVNMAELDAEDESTDALSNAIV
jgi:hypothetical protein